MPKNIAISGASGFIGSYLVEFFQRQGDTVVPLTREILYDRQRLKHRLLGCEVIINLAGAPINHRWSRRYKQELVKSRIEVTRNLVSVVNELAVKPLVFISASAVGIYSPQGCHSENYYREGEGFLADLCREWEAASRHISPQVRVVNPRFGIVLSLSGGAFPKMTTGARRGVVIVPGSGRQILSWIALEDLARAMEFLIEQPELEGPVNFTAPVTLAYREFARLTARYFHSVGTLRIPDFVFRLLLGKASSLLLDGPCALPDKLLRAGFVFQTYSFEDFLGSHDGW